MFVLAPTLRNFDRQGKALCTTARRKLVYYDALVDGLAVLATLLSCFFSFALLPTYCIIGSPSSKFQRYRYCNLAVAVSGRGFADDLE